MTSMQVPKPCTNIVIPQQLLNHNDVCSFPICLVMDKFNRDELYFEVELGNFLNPKYNKPLTDLRFPIAGMISAVLKI